MKILGVWLKKVVRTIVIAHRNKKIVYMRISVCVNCLL